MAIKLIGNRQDIRVNHLGGIYYADENIDLDAYYKIFVPEDGGKEIIIAGRHLGSACRERGLVNQTIQIIGVEI